ncbi:MAG: hypothetical protein IKS00_05670 [Bacteroidales bacterium]|nr:hypothetical protein [Bacteroidales bacterium]
MDTTVLKCPTCGSNLQFNAETQNFKCDFCGSAFTQEEIFKITKDSDEDTRTQGQDIESQPELNLFACRNCGAEMVTDENTAATFCVYCGSAGIMKSRLEGKFRPELIIPFKTTKQDAINAYNNYRKGKHLAPDEFGKKENIEKITGVYIPFWLYDGNSRGFLSGERHDITTWRSGDYRYTKTDIYHVERAGDISFEKVPADGSKKFDDDTMDSIEPFDFNEFQPFNYSFLSGFLAEKYDVGPEEDKERAQLRMGNSLMASLYGTISGSLLGAQQQKDTVFTGIRYAMLPVWMLNTKIKDKMHTFAMNGQTGKIVGDIPIDKGKAWRFFFVRTLIAMAILCGLSWLFFM